MCLESKSVPYEWCFVFNSRIPRQWHVIELTYHKWCTSCCTEPLGGWWRSCFYHRVRVGCWLDRNPVGSTCSAPCARTSWSFKWLQDLQVQRRRCPVKLLHFAVAVFFSSVRFFWCDSCNQRSSEQNLKCIYIENRNKLHIRLDIIAIESDKSEKVMPG